MAADLKRYDLFGWDYESRQPLTDEEFNWHRTRAERTGGPVLVLASGTGRLACRLAMAGFHVVGIDLSDTMLAIARRHADELPADAAARVEFVKADMSDFRLGGAFGLACIPDNSLRELDTAEAMLSCLRSVRDHTRPAGEILITEPPVRPVPLR